MGMLLLAHGAEHLLHLQGGFVLIGDDAGGAVGETDRGADVLDLVAEGGLDLFEQGLEGFGGLGLVVGLGLVLEVLAGGGLVDGLEVGLAVLVDAGEDDLIDVVVEDEDFDVLLLVDLKQG